LIGRAKLLVPQRFAVEHPEHAGICGVVVLDRLGVRRHEVIARAPLVERDLAGDDGQGGSDERSRGDHAKRVHSTAIEADAVSVKPLSPIHSNSNLPLSLATVKKEMNGLAAIAGKKSARKISAPL